MYAEDGGIWIGQMDGNEPEGRANARLAALMHPPVALALAGLLDLEAVVIGKSEAIGMRLSYSAEKSVALARAILREEES
jgi:hypothetical protein